MIRRIHHLGIRVRNFDRMVAFYKQAFGFEAAGEELDLNDHLQNGDSGQLPRVIMMRAGNCFLEIMQDESARGDHDTGHEAFAGNYAHISIEVTDIEQEYQRLKDIGMTFEEPAPRNYGHVKSGHGRDPEGNDIELLQTVHKWDCDLDALLHPAPC